MNFTTGSMADVPKDWIQEIKKLEELFSVDTSRLKHITDHFVSELEKGEHLPFLPKLATDILKV